jgi:hypothetical protein
MNSTDQTLKNRTTPAGPADSPTESTRATHKLDLSPTKTIGGALAAMTAAALGAQLSLVGTVIGAAVASVIAAVAGALYTASLERTGHRVRRVWQRDDAPAATTTSDPEPEDTALRPGVPAARRRLSWSSVLVGALAAFGLAAMALTAVELVTGHALSGGEGTTVTQVSGGDDKPPVPAESPSPSPTSEQTMSAEPTESPTTETSPSEATTPTPDPDPDPDPTMTPSSPEPTETETAPSATPSPTASRTMTAAP